MEWNMLKMQNSSTLQLSPHRLKLSQLSCVKLRGYIKWMISLVLMGCYTEPEQSSKISVCSGPTLSPRPEADMSVSVTFDHSILTSVVSCFVNLRCKCTAVFNVWWKQAQMFFILRHFDWLDYKRTSVVMTFWWNSGHTGETCVKCDLKKWKNSICRLNTLWVSLVCMLLPCCGGDRWNSVK